MLKKILIPAGILACTFSIASADWMSSSDVWFAKMLRAKFSKTIEINDRTFKLSSLACLPTDITRFDLNPKRGGGALAVNGKLRVGPLPSGFTVLNPKKPQYMLILQAYLFSPSGSLVWAQLGYPKGGAWIDADGGTVSFILIDEYAGSTSGYELIVLVAGDPIIGEGDEGMETPVVLGAKKMTLE